MTSKEKFYPILAEHVKEQFGAPIRNQNDCKALSEQIQIDISITLSSHTLRRFFSLVQPSGNFSLSTLDTLSKYTGHAEFEAFIEYVRKEEETLEIVSDHAHDEKNLELYFLGKLMSRRISVEACMMVAYTIKQKIHQKEYERALNLMKLLSPLMKHRESAVGILSSVAHYLGPTCHAMSSSKLIDRFIQEPIYSDIVLSFYVPDLEIGGNYGKHIRAMVANSRNLENKIFGTSLLLTHSILLGQQHDADQQHDQLESLLAESEQKGPDISHSPILIGRLAVLKFLRSKSNEANSILPFLLPKEKATIFYFKAIIPILLLTDNLKAMNELFDNYSPETLPTKNWFERAIMQQIILAKYWIQSHDGFSKEDMNGLKNEVQSFTWPRDLQKMSDEMMTKIEKNVQN